MKWHSRLHRIALSLLISVSLTPQFRAQELASTQTQETPKPSVDRAELHQALLDLTNTWTVMCVAAHPDDEDGTTLTMLRRKYGIHTVSLFSTYGEGGQNAVGPDLYEKLGVIRAHETMAAAAIQGSEPYFLGLRDFGFSKSADETFRAWGEKEALRRMVMKLRQLRPDVIITNHNTATGHGHHQATGRLLLQAFDEAANPNSFPEQLREVGVWQPKRLFVRFGFENNAETKALDDAAEKAGKVVVVDPNEKDPIRGTSYAEQALTALQQHATQGPWPKSISDRLRSQNRTELPKIRYRLAKEVSSAPGLPPDSKNFVEGLRLPLTIGARLAPPAVNAQPITDFTDHHGEALVALVNAKKAGAFSAPEEVVASDPQRFRLMSERLDRAIAVASGISLALAAKESTLVPTVESQFSATIANAGDEDIEVKRVTFTDWGVNRPLDIAEKLPPGTDTSVAIKSTTPQTASVTIPASEHLYDNRFLGQPLSVTAALEIAGVPFSITAEKNIPVAPIVEIKNLSLSPVLWSRKPGAQHPTLNVTLTNNLPREFRGAMVIDNDRYFRNSLRQIVLGAGETRDFSIQDTNQPATTSRRLLKFKLPQSTPQRVESSSVVVSIEQTDQTSPLSTRSIQPIYVEPRVVPGTIGYIPSFDDTLKNALAALGLAGKELKADEIKDADLSGYDTIIIDNRGYQAHPELIKSNQRLLDYVQNGGTLIVFYHKTNEWNPDERRGRPQLAPYPIILDDERVTEEDAPVRILKPNHPLLNYPNRITLADFKGWVQERGLYYPKDWDKQYVALLSSNDQGEPPLNGGLLVGRYGKGNYIYTSMVWYRQLQAGVPGGYRFFANLVSYGRQARPN
jgi:LmbE family N-acetylglucosaminyl deacetylase